MSRSMPELREDGDHVIVEAPTAEAALELVAERLGTRAQIASVERVRRGGVRGFFARELVQVTATGDQQGEGERQRAGGRGSGGGERQGTGGPGPAPDSTDASDGTGTVVDLLLERIERDDPFSEVLREQLEGVRGAPEQAFPVEDVDTTAPPVPRARASVDSELEPPRHDPPPVESGTPRAQGEQAPRLAGTPQWTLSNLCRLGLSGLLSDTDVAGLDAHDDVGWTMLLARRLTPLCLALPTGPTIVVGTRAGRLADVLKLEVCSTGGQTSRDSFVAPIGDSDDERAWLRSVRGTRRLHLVVGDSGWRGLLFDEPSTLSWTGGGLCNAVSLAAMLGLRLGYAVPYAGTPSRATPIDVAVAIRRLLPLHG